MKRKLLLGLLVAAGFSANAQLANGTVAPDFTATDINGETHTLSEYLAEGKTVMLEISATWCGPCWAFHSAHIFADFHNSYGPGGSDEVVVLYIEGDGQTTLADIQGTGNNTQGDWTEGTPFPIIDNASIATLYQITYYPTIYRICPEGTTTLVSTNNINTVAALKNNVNNACGSLTGAENHTSLQAEDMRACELTGNAQATLKNYGVNAITAATVVLKENGSEIATQDYTGNIAQYGNATVTFNDVTFEVGADYEFEVTNVNATTPYNDLYTSKEVGFEQANESQNNLDVRVYTDNYPGEISWRIKDSEGTVVATGGPYTAGPGAAGAGGPNANTTMNHWIDNMPEGIDCYSVELLDSYGDGWSLGNTPHGIEIFSSGVSVFQKMVGNFGTLDVTDSAFKTNGTLGNNNFEVPANIFSIYPNPSTGIFNFATSQAVSVTVMDLTGKVVFTAQEVNDGGTINLSSLQKGMYIAKVNGDNFEKTEKIVIN